MGISKSAYRLLLEEKKKGVLKGESILQLGRQLVRFDYATLLKYAKIHGVQLVSVEPQLSFNANFRKLGYIDDITLFKALGFKNVQSLDYSDFEGADITWDLNQPLPEKYWGKYDAVYDGGTAEHVFHFPQVLANIHHLLKPHGVIIHVSPSHNHVDHGFYMYSPQVYFEYYSANHYTILTSQVFEFGPNPKAPWLVYPYQPGVLDTRSSGGFGGKMLAIHMVAQKTSQSTCGAIPQQGGYVKIWNTALHKPSQVKSEIGPVILLGLYLKRKIGPFLPFRLKRYLKRKKLPKYTEY